METDETDPDPTCRDGRKAIILLFANKYMNATLNKLVGPKQVK